MSVPFAATTARLIVDPLLSVVFPSRCPACQSTLAHPTRGPLCDACWRTLPRHQEPLCRCGFPLPPAAGGACGRCRRGLSLFEAGASLGPYEGGLRALIHELKYRRRRRVASRLAESLMATRAVQNVLSPGAVLVPVPLHPRRKRDRGFNQSELLAREVAQRSKLEFCADALVRRRDTATQTGLTAAARRQNVAGAFAVRRRARVAGRVVVLVDDVLTTGATARSCARALQNAGARAVRLLTVARVG